MLDNFENTTDISKRELIIKYQRTNKNSDFYELLGIFDDYLVYLVGRFQKRYYYLKRVDSQELYQEAILSFRKAILALPENWEVKSIPFWIGSYVKEYFKQRYRNVNKLVILPDFVIAKKQESSNIPTEEYQKFLDIIDVQSILQSNILTKHEMEFVQDKYYKCMETRDLQKKYGLTCSGIWRKNDRICKKLKKYLL